MNATSALATVTFGVSVQLEYVQPCAILSHGRPLDHLSELDEVSLRRQYTPRCAKFGVSADVAAVLRYHILRRRSAALRYVWLPAGTTLDGVQRHMAAGKVDCTLLTWAVNDERLAKFLYAYPIYTGGGKWLMGGQSRLHNFVWHVARVFVPSGMALWIPLVATAMILLATRSLLLRIPPMADVSASDTSVSVWHQLRHALPHSGGAGRRSSAAPPRRAAFALLTLALSLTVLLLFSLYQKLMLADILRIFPPMLTRIDDFDQLVEALERGDVRLLQQERDHWLPIQIYESPLPEYRRLREAVRHNPIVFNSNLSQWPALLMTGDYVAHVDHGTARLVFGRRPSAEERCSISVRQLKAPRSMQQPPTQSFLCNKAQSEGMRRKVAALNEAIRANYDLITRTIERNYEMGGSRRRCDKAAATGWAQYKRITVGDVIGAFVMLAVAFVLAAALLLLECFKRSKTPICTFLWRKQYAGV